MFRFKFFISEGRQPSLRINLYLRGHGNTKVSTGIKMDKATLVNCFLPCPLPRNSTMSALLKRWEQELRALRTELFVKGQPVSMPEVRELVLAIIRSRPGEPEDDNGPTFYSAFSEFVSHKTNTGTLSVYRQTESRLDAYDPSWRKLKFADIDFRWLTKFESFLSLTASKNARNIHLRNIRAVFNYAIDVDMTNLYPFRRFKIRSEETRKRSLTLRQLRGIIRCDCYPDQEIYRDMFLLMFMLAGINSKDLHSLKDITDDGRIEYRRAKTGKILSVKVEPEAMEIIERYRGKKGLLCISDRWREHGEFTRKFNHCLKKLGAERCRGGAGNTRPEGQLKGGVGQWPELSTYWARHTWATIAAELDVPDAVIAQALGHSSDRIIDIYIRRNMRKVDEANRKVLDYVLYDRK